jgi:isopentenyl phosphate kinase
MQNRQEVMLVKLGGSLITDKRVESSYRAEVAQRIAEEIADVWNRRQVPLIIGHGSGSFGHFAAKRYNTVQGVHTPEQWRGFAEVAAAAADLNTRFTETLRAAGLPILRFQPSASLQCHNGKIMAMELAPVQKALRNGLVPLIYGDVAFDEVLGGTIASTETIFTYLVQQLDVARVILVGEVEGVYDDRQQVIPEITPANFQQYQMYLGGSEGTDVTGGMLTKVGDMVNLVEEFPWLRVQIIDGLRPGVLRAVVDSDTGVKHGTLIHSGSIAISD